MRPLDNGLSGVIILSIEVQNMNQLIQSVKENLSFLAVCLLVFLALYLVAWLFEKYVL